MVAHALLFMQMRGNLEKKAPQNDKNLFIGEICGVLQSVFIFAASRIPELLTCVHKHLKYFILKHG